MTGMIQVQSRELVGREPVTRGIVEIKKERPVWFRWFISRLVANIAQRPELLSEDLAEFFYLKISTLIQIHSMCELSVDSVNASGTQDRHVFSIDTSAFCADLTLAAFEYGVREIKAVEGCDDSEYSTA